MSIRNEFPDFAAIEEHIHRARLERSLAVSQAIVAAITASSRGLKRLASRLAPAPRPAKPDLCPR